jgi:hypothetical protein
MILIKDNFNNFNLKLDIIYKKLIFHNKSLNEKDFKSKLTCVSGYWIIKNKHNNSFTNWFEKSLRINCPYVFFGNKESINLVKKYRRELPTHYIEYNIKDFTSYKYKDNMITHNDHCPSIELNLIWNEKIFMIQKAAEINPFLSNFFGWIDAGVCVYRKKPPPTIPFPNITKLNNLPVNKFIYTSSSCNFNEVKFQKGKYHLYHHISGNYILHINIIDQFVMLYSKYLKLIDKSDIWTDQVILTLIYKEYPELFYKYSDGYGTILTEMY